MRRTGIDPGNTWPQWLAVLSAVGGVLLLLSCGGADSGPAPAVMRGDVAGVGFDCPTGWSIAADPDDDAVTLVTRRTIGKFGPILFLQVRRDPQARSVATILDDLARSAAEEPKFELVRQETLTHPQGFDYGLVEYGRELSNVAVTERFVVVPLEDDKQLMIGALTRLPVWAQHAPVFDALVASLTLPAEGR